MVTIEYFCHIKRNGNFITTDKHYIQRSTYELAMKDLREVMRIYNSSLINIICTIYPYNH